ncbi:hypothetical protein GNF83_18725, partial [Clostridium perfringens]|nr:hypothetical protein [Clostridium perfringens]
EKNPYYPYSYLNLAVLYREKNYFYKAIEVITEGIENNSDSGFLYYNRSCFYSNIDELHKSFKDLVKSIELNDLFLDYMMKDKELDKLRNLKEYNDYLKSKL